MKYSKENPPECLPESGVTGKFRHDTGEYVPSGGFIQDFVLYTRGIETPTKFAVWAAIYTLSALLKRDAYMKWFPKPLYPNIFLMFVAPPRICAKSTCVDIGEETLQLVPGFYTDELLKASKQINAHRSKATPEVLFDLMKPRKVELPKEKGGEDETPEDKIINDLNKKRSQPVPEENPDTTEETFTTISELSLIISELTTFLGKQKYNEALIDILTYFYDCPDRADEATRSYGVQSLKNVYLTFFGATTPDSFNKSLPETAFGGGFLSRSIIVSNYLPTRSFPIPSLLEGAPSKHEIAERLAWVGATAWGQFQFGKEAYTEYITWYKNFKESLVGDPLADAKARMDTNLIKLCVLICAQRYDSKKIISKQDFLDAKVMITEALEGSKDLYSGANGSEYYNLLRQIEKYIAKHGTLTRSQLLREFTTKKITPEELTKIISHLMQSEVIEVRSSNGKLLSLQTEQPGEKIKYVGGEL